MSAIFYEQAYPAPVQPVSAYKYSYEFELPNPRYPESKIEISITFEENDIVEFLGRDVWVSFSLYFCEQKITPLSGLLPINSWFAYSWEGRSKKKMATSLKYSLFHREKPYRHIKEAKVVFREYL